MCMNAKFFLTGFSLTSFICWCERINKFSLTSFHCSQQYNYTVDEKKITTTRRQFRFYIIGHAYLTREKRLLARGRGCANAIWAIEETYESELVGSPSGNAKTKSVSRFCKQLSAWTKRRRWGTFSQLFPFTSIRYSKHHNNKTAVRPQFPNFLWQVSLSTRTDEQILQCDNFFLAKCTCSKAIMLAFEQVHLSRKKLTNSSLHTSK